MKFKTVSLFLLVALQCAQSAHWLDVAAARSNSMQTTWKAAVSSRFQNISRLEVLAMMGVLMPEHQRSLVSLPKSSSASSVALPTTFSVLEQWPQCASRIMDQGVRSRDCVCFIVFRILFSGNCGSCWAIGTGASLADRLCIASNASKVWLTLNAPLSILSVPKQDTFRYLMFPFLRRFSRVALPTKRSSAVTRFLPTKHA